MRDKVPGPRGRMRLVGPDGQPLSQWKGNLFLRQWSVIAAKLLAEGDRSCRINGMYIEFVNVASPGDPASVPTYDRDPASAVAYYDGLADSGDRDYLRVPMIAASITSGDEELYPDGNVITFFAQTQGGVGVHGKTYDAASNSLVIGGALVAQRVAADPTQDFVLSRAYLDVEDQKAKPDVGQVGFTWEVTLE